MALSKPQKQMLSDVGSQILNVLDRVAREAQNKLSSGRSQSTQALAAGTNIMVDGIAASRNLAAIHSWDRENLRRLEREPFVAQVAVVWADEDPPREETLFVSRASAAGMSDELLGVRLVTYTSPLGRVAEFTAGDSTVLSVGGRSREIIIQNRVQLHPERKDAQWDAVNDTFEFEAWNVILESVRAFLEQLGQPAVLVEDVPDVLGALLEQDAEANIVRQTLRRGVIEHIALRDQPILDRYQGEIFRMPLDRRLILLGPPGTGKSTTLIRRLAQKRTADALTSDESKKLSSEGLSDTFLYSDSWAMFSPTELLKLYLRDAFNREGVPASDNNLKTWDKERLHLARNVLGILRSAQSGTFQLDETADILSDTSSAGVSQLYEEFSSYFENEILSRSTDSFDQLQSSQDEELRRRIRSVVGSRPTEGLSVRELSLLLEEVSTLQPELRRLEDEIKDDLRNLFNKLVFTHDGILEQVAEALSSIGRDAKAEDEEDEDEEDEEQILLPHEPRSEQEQRRLAAEAVLDALRKLARSLALGRSSPGGRAGSVVSILSDRLPPTETLSKLGGRIIIRSQLRALIQSPRLFVMRAARSYNRFRRQAAKEGRWFKSNAIEAIRQRRITAAEVDVLILAMLRNTRRLLERSPQSLVSSTSHDWLENIKSQYLMQVFVDEATDFSVLQLACTMELSHPRIRSWFACGDFDQRITSYGIRNGAEIEWLGKASGDSIEMRNVDIAYRQSPRLRELAIALSSQSASESINLKAPDRGDGADVWPLLAEHHHGDRLGSWLADRISEVEKAVGKLPSIAIFVDSEERIDPLVNLVQPLLARHNVPIVGCKDGRLVGDNLEVRVFDVRHIKGLEFEAVFFVGIDGLAERLPDLFDRFFYVGASRAATYLGITCDETLPSSLERVRTHFSTGDWYA